MLAAPPSDLREVALTEPEYRRIVSLLGREPTRLELGMFGALWSEHCSYKTSKSLLASLPVSGPAVLQGPGENAGAVDIGDGLAAVFKMESHNHPSAIEPYQGAATGVGGILRDVFTMGARPIAILDSLRFGDPDTPKGRYLFSGVVAGIGGYGNCFGCPTVGGEIFFDPAYADNPVVNAMCVGLVAHDRLRRARADQVGDVLLLVGADTGRDGIHGATFASIEMDHGSLDRRPAVQVGNPFLEKLLCEACLQLNELDGVVAIQDLGAAGLTSAACELAHRGGRGVALDVTRVSRREQGMTPYEVMLSESQERMLVLVRKEAEHAAREVFDRFELHADRIGTITRERSATIRDGRRTEAAIPLEALLEQVPVPVPAARPTPPTPAAEPFVPVYDPEAALLEMLRRPNLRSRRPVFRTYDHQVQNGTVIPPGGDAAVLRIPGTRRGLAMTTDGNPWYVALDPATGTMAAVAEAARNLVCTGARPLALTNCLNFGNPERPEIFWQLQESIRGLGHACRVLGVPVVSGNVSLYNETDGRNILPTPVIGMIGILDDLDRRCQARFQADGDLIFLLGDSREELDGSEYSRLLGVPLRGSPPRVDLEAELHLQQGVLAAIADGVLHSAHDLAEGGLLIALAECVLMGGLGARCPALRSTNLSPAAVAFGESQGRVLVTAEARRVPDLQAIMLEHHVPVQAIGVVGGEELRAGAEIRCSIERLREAWNTPW